MPPPPHSVAGTERPALRGNRILQYRGPPSRSRVRAARSSVRHSEPRRMLLRGTIRAPIAEYQPGPIGDLSKTDRPRFFGDQTGLGSPFLALLRLRQRLELHSGGDRIRRRPRPRLRAHLPARLAGRCLAALAGPEVPDSTSIIHRSIPGTPRPTIGAHRSPPLALRSGDRGGASRLLR